MSWTETQKKYAHSEKGIAARKRFMQSEKGKALMTKYQAKRKAKRQEIKKQKNLDTAPVAIEVKNNKKVNKNNPKLLNN